MTTATQPQNLNLAEHSLMNIYEIGITAASGAIAGHWWTLVNPVGGAIFGATVAIANKITNALTHKLDIRAPEAKVAAFAITFIAKMGLAFLVTTALGFPMTVSSLILMPLAMFAAGIVMRAGLACLQHCLGLGVRPTLH